jgi:beta-glucosidase
MTSLINLWL